MSSGDDGQGGALRIEELSRRSEVSVRNIREYQDRGLLPPPEREGRVALYREEHLVRLRLISRLLSRGYTLAVIRDLLDAWAGGRDLHHVLGLEAVVSRPWGDDEPVRLTREQVDVAFGGQLSGDGLRLLLRSGVFVADGDGFRCPYRRLAEAVPTLIAEGIGADAAAAAVAAMRRSMDAVADEMVRLVVTSLLPEGLPQGLPVGETLAGMAASIERLRQVADIVAGSLFGLAMTASIDRAVGLTTDRALSGVPGGPPSPGR